MHSLLVALVLIGCDRAPEGGLIAISPDIPTTVDDLVVTVEEEAVDPKGDPVTYVWEWSVDGVVVDDLIEDTVPADRTRRGETWSVVAVPTDGELEGEPIAASVQIANSFPLVETLEIVPANPAVTDDLSLTYTTADADDDAVTVAISWSVNGTEVGSDETLTADNFAKGDEVTVTVTPSDDALEGEPVTASVVIGNTPPVLSNVTLEPEAVGVEGSLTVSYETADDDGDDVTVGISWTVDGVEVGTDATLDASTLAKGDEVTVTLTPNDGAVDGEVATATTTILNTAPVASDLAVDPGDVTVAGTLTATFSTADADGDVVTNTISWTVDGTEVGTGETLAASGLAKGDVVTVTVTPNDGEADGEAVSTTVNIINAAPTVSNVSVSPSEVGVEGTLTVSYDAADLDSDATTETIVWTVDGSEVGTGATLSASALAKGDVVTVTVIANDGEADSEPASGTATIINTVPAVSGVSIQPGDVTVSGTLTADYQLSDVDGDTVSESIVWTVGGSEVGTGPTLAASTLSKGDVVTVTITPNDGESDGAAGSATATILNTAPVASNLAIEPGDVTVSGQLTASYDLDDADGDTVNASVVWTVDGNEVGTGSSLSAASLSKGDVVTVTVTPNDGDSDGDEISASVNILNSAPTAPTAFISPEAPTYPEELLCELDEASTDADSDSITYSVQWFLDGTPWEGSVETTVITGDTLPTGEGQVDEAWTCAISATDGDATTEGDPSDAVTFEVGDVYFAAGYYWVIADYAAPRNDHSAVCQSVGLEATSNNVTLTWNADLLSELSQVFGFSSAGDANNSARSMWCFDGGPSRSSGVEDGECETHNFGTYYDNYGAWTGYDWERPVFTCQE